MPIELIQKVLSEAPRTGLREIIPSTMGEPLLYAEFEEILRACAQYHVKLNLTTNGTFPRLGAEKWAEKLVPVTSDIKISWNGATAATHEAIMIGTQWEKVLENVETLVRVRDAHARSGGNYCRLTFQLTFLETNTFELAEIVRLAARLGIDRVKGHHLWAHFSEIQALSMRRSPESIARWNTAVQAAHNAAEQNRLPSGKKVLLENIFPLSESAISDLALGGPCPFLGQEAWISAEGRFNPCCAPDAQRRTLGEFGSLHEQDFASIWEGPAYRRLSQGYAAHRLCLSCNMRKPVEEKP